MGDDGDASLLSFQAGLMMRCEIVGTG